MQDDLRGLFFAAFDAMNDAAIAIDHDGMVIAGNAAFEALFGFSGTNGDVLPFHRLCVDSETNDISPSPLSAVLLNAPARQRYRRSDGTCFWGERSTAPIQRPDGTLRGLFLVIRHSTDRALLEAGMATLLTLPTIASKQDQHCMTTFLELGCRHFGVEHGCLGHIERLDYLVDAVGGSLALHQVGDRLPLNETFINLPRDQGGLLVIEDCGRSTFREHAYYQETGLEFYLASEIWVEGQLYGTLSFADRSARKTPIAEHDKILLRVMARWAAMLLEGRMTQSALSLATHDLERFAYIASHDLHEPLRRVVTHCQILMEDFGAEVSDEGVEVVEIIQASSKSMRFMLNDLLTYSRLNQQLQQAFEPVDMASIVCHAIDDLEPKLAHQKIELKVAHLPLIWGREALLQLVCYHLLSNAIKFTGDRPPSVDISVQDQGRYWQFSVTDQGIGIEPRFAERIFDIFQRLHSKDDFSGSGAGLAICKLIIERHGGAIWLDTTYLKGTRMVFTLPKDRSAIRAKMAPMHP